MTTCCLGNAEDNVTKDDGLAEELKMTIRKTTARKGRRSKSRDVLKEEDVQAAGGSKDISIDITLNVQAGTPPTTSDTGHLVHIQQ
ncbi:GD22104 [Drosophila simulans]|uniref:GD22104 n=1 Tax=Drosophila simulans TaxID=7240 RepID=B4Q485_DROSI|nr:GD22104 [Drosophila simulans]